MQNITTVILHAKKEAKRLTDRYGSAQKRVGGTARDRVEGYSKASVFSPLPVGAPALAKAVAAGSRAVSVPPPTDDGYTPTSRDARDRKKGKNKSEITTVSTVFRVKV